jgi:dihydroorotase
LRPPFYFKFYFQKMNKLPAVLRIPLPDDFHIHLRQDAALQAYAQDASMQFGRVLVMPNTLPPVTEPLRLREYKRQIENSAPGLEALMTFKLNAAYTREDLQLLKNVGAIAGKYYPAGVTTNSQDGIGDFESVLPVVAHMEQLGIVLCLHGEEPGAFCLDREVQFLHRVERLVKEFPKLKIVLEHISTRESVSAVERWPANVAATITLHHLLLTLDDVIGDGLMPHHFCKPLLKRPEDRAALRQAAFSGNPKFFFGSDSAPHAKGKKECPCGAAGVYSAPVAAPLLVQLFADAEQFERLPDFVAKFGATFYGLPLTTRTLVLQRTDWTVPAETHGVVPLFAGQTLHWKIKDIEHH